jgi:acrylyl-CoA reductase (NADPH)
MITYKALWVEEQSDGTFTKKISDRSIHDLPEHEVLISVKYSALNYKDALSASGHKGITRNFPFQPGIDAAGVVVESTSREFKGGDEVFVTGYDLGMNTFGGFAEYIRVPAKWIVKKPDKMTLRDTMIYGTAGFTAGICINELEKHVNRKSDDNKIVVTGATGGVGSLAVAMLSKAGYYVIASTGKREQREMLSRLGAKEIVDRRDLVDESDRPLLRGQWNGAIDTVGGTTLSTVIRSTKLRGAICCLGLVESDTLNMKIYPFLLRGVTLIGIDSAEQPMDYRKKLWQRISQDWLIKDREHFVKEVSLDELPQEIDTILEGKQSGKVVVKID